MEFSSFRKANNLLFCSIVSQALDSLLLLPFKLNGFDEATLLGVTMTESRTQRDRESVEHGLTTRQNKELSKGGQKPSLFEQMSDDE